MPAVAPVSVRFALALGAATLVLGLATSGPFAAAVQNVAFTPLANVYRQDFEFGAAGWVVAGAAASWELGAPGWYNGPVGAFSGARAWATNLDGPHNPGECATLTSPSIHLPPYGAHVGTNQVDAARVFFHHWVEMEMAYDAGVVQVSTDGGQTWRTREAPYQTNVLGAARACVAPGASESTPLVGWTGWYDEEWVPGAVDLTSHLGQRIQLRFLFASDATNERAGWAVDDVRVQVGMGG